MLFWCNTLIYIEYFLVCICLTVIISMGHSDCQWGIRAKRLDHSIHTGWRIATGAFRQRCIATGAFRQRCIPTGAFRQRCIATGAFRQRCIATGAFRQRCIATGAFRQRCIATGFPDSSQHLALTGLPQ